MYTNKQLSSFDIMNTIEDSDIYNSQFLATLDTLPKKEHELTKISGERLDLVSNSIYDPNDTVNYAGLLGVLNRITDESVITKVNYIDKTVLSKVGV